MNMTTIEQLIALVLCASGAAFALWLLVRCAIWHHQVRDYQRKHPYPDEER